MFFRMRASRTRKTEELLRALDQLTEQNRRIAEQNQQLIDQINVLQKVLAGQGS